MKDFYYHVSTRASLVNGKLYQVGDAISSKGIPGIVSGGRSLDYFFQCVDVSASVYAEFAFEAGRVCHKNGKLLPSRLGASFACETLEEALHFLNYVRIPSIRIEKLVQPAIYKVRIKDPAKKWGKFDMRLYDLAMSAPIQDFTSYVKRYWDGEDSTKPFHEYLFESEFEIVEIINVQLGSEVQK
jgi:hypothetical protein